MLQLLDSHETADPGLHRRAPAGVADLLQALVEQLEELTASLEAEIDTLEERYDALAEELETIALRPRKADVEVHVVALAWKPA